MGWRNNAAAFFKTLNVAEHDLFRHDSAGALVLCDAKDLAELGMSANDAARIIEQLKDTGAAFEPIESLLNRGGSTESLDCLESLLRHLGLLVHLPMCLKEEIDLGAAPG